MVATGAGAGAAALSVAAGVAAGWPFPHPQIEEYDQHHPDQEQIRSPMRLEDGEHDFLPLAKFRFCPATHNYPI